MFNDLAKIDVSNHIEKKGKFSYLSWPFAWAEIKKYDPDATFDTGAVEYHQDNSATVYMTLKINGLVQEMFLPVMDYKNNAIVNPNANDINKARMRCLVKAAGMQGLGLYIYAGEDLPEAVKQDELREAKNDLLHELHEMADAIGADLNKTKAHYKVDSLAELSMDQIQVIYRKMSLAVQQADQKKAAA